MRLFDRFRRKSETEYVMWQDGYHRSFEPMQQPDRGIHISPEQKRGFAKLAAAGLLMAGAYFSGALEAVQDYLSTDTASAHAPHTAPMPQARPSDFR